MKKSFVNLSRYPKKVPTSPTFEFLAIDEKSTFYFFALFGHIKRGFFFATYLNLGQLHPYNFINLYEYGHLPRNFNRQINHTQAKLAFNTKMLMA